MIVTGVWLNEIMILTVYMYVYIQPFIFFGHIIIWLLHNKVALIVFSWKDCIRFLWMIFTCEQYYWYRLLNELVFISHEQMKKRIKVMKLPLESLPLIVPCCVRSFVCIPDVKPIILLLWQIQLKNHKLLSLFASCRSCKW